MGKFRKKPVVIEAEQWPENAPPDFPGIDGVYCGMDGNLYIESLEGKLSVTPGDWIITGVKGEKYPCKPDIFEETYDKVEE